MHFSKLSTSLVFIGKGVLTLLQQQKYKKVLICESGQYKKY
mgnify:CR=1 FL=1